MICFKKEHNDIFPQSMVTVRMLTTMIFSKSKLNKNSETTRNIFQSRLTGGHTIFLPGDERSSVDIDPAFQSYSAHKLVWEMVKGAPGVERFESSLKRLQIFADRNYVSFNFGNCISWCVKLGSSVSKFPTFTTSFVIMRWCALVMSWVRWWEECLCHLNGSLGHVFFTAKGQLEVQSH